MLTAGVATRARTGRLIDRFRDRIIFPITNHDGEVLGFVGRRHPDLTDTALAGPKYLNTAETPLFHKGAQLFGAQNLAAGQIPVIVEGPIDAIAVTLAGGGRYVGVAPLGTSLTDEQATQLAHHGIDPIVATDADIPGQVAAERAFWHLTPHGLNPRYATWPDGTDPADVLTRHGPHTLLAALDRAQPLGDALVEERLAHLPARQARAEAIRIIAAQPPTQWDAGSDQHRRPARNPGRADPAGTPDRRPGLEHATPKPQPNDALTKINTSRPDSPPSRPRQSSDGMRSPPNSTPDSSTKPTGPPPPPSSKPATTTATTWPPRPEPSSTNAPLGALPAQDLRYRLLAHLDIPIDEPPSDPATSTEAIRRGRHEENPHPPDQPHTYTHAQGAESSCPPVTG